MYSEQLALTLFVINCLGIIPVWIFLIRDDLKYTELRDRTFNKMIDIIVLSGMIAFIWLPLIIAFGGGAIVIFGLTKLGKCMEQRYHAWHTKQMQEASIPTKKDTP